MKGLTRFTWWLTKWGLMLAVAAAVVAVPYFYQRMDEEIRRRVEACLAKQYPDLGVSVRSAQLVEGQGVEIRGVSIREFPSCSRFASLRLGTSGPNRSCAAARQASSVSAEDRKTTSPGAWPRSSAALPSEMLPGWAARRCIGPQTAPAASAAVMARRSRPFSPITTSRLARVSSGAQARS